MELAAEAEAAAVVDAALQNETVKMPLHCKMQQSKCPFNVAQNGRVTGDCSK